MADIWRLAVLIVFAAGCGGGRSDVQCEENANCNLHPDGLCEVYTTTLNQWCTYPDSTCPVGRRWSDLDTGDGLSGICVGGNTQADAGPDASTSIDALTSDAALPDAQGDAGPQDYLGSYGGSGNDFVDKMIPLADGGAIVVGSFSGDFDIDGASLAWDGGIDIFVARFDAFGRRVWAKRFGTEANERATGMALDGAGDVILVGYFVETISFGGPSLAAENLGQDLFVAKLDGDDGSHLWSVGHGGSDDEYADGVALDSTAIFVTGRFVGTSNFGGDNRVSSGGSDVFLAKYSLADGAHAWDIAIGGSQNEYAEAIAVDADGVYVAGNFRGTANFGGSDLTSSAADDVFLARYLKTNGSHSWSNRYGGAGNEYAPAVGVSGAYVYLGAESSATASFGGSLLVGQGRTDILLARYTASTGAHSWSVRYGGSNGDQLRSIVIDGSTIYAAGSFSVATKWGGDTLNAAGGIDMAFAQFNTSNGGHISSFRLGGVLNDDGTGYGPFTGGTLIAGNYNAVVYIGGMELTASGTDWFLHRQE